MAAAPYGQPASPCRTASAGIGDGMKVELFSVQKVSLVHPCLLHWSVLTFGSNINQAIVASIIGFQIPSFTLGRYYFVLVLFN